MIGLTIKGETFVFRVPKVEDLTKFSQMLGEQSSEAHRHLLTSSAVDESAVSKWMSRRSAAHVPAARALLSAIGWDAELQLLEPDEITDEAMAKAYVEITKREEGSDLALLPVVGTIGKKQLTCILRLPTEREIDTHAKHDKDVGAAIGLARTLREWGNSNDFESTHPGILVSLTGLAIQQAGLFDKVIVGEV